MRKTDLRDCMLHVYREFKKPNFDLKPFTSYKAAPEIPMSCLDLPASAGLENSSRNVGQAGLMFTVPILYY